MSRGTFSPTPIERCNYHRLWPLLAARCRCLLLAVCCLLFAACRLLPRRSTQTHNSAYGHPVPTILRCEQAPVAGKQESRVHGLPSSHRLSPLSQHCPADTQSPHPSADTLPYPPVLYASAPVLPTDSRPGSMLGKPALYSGSPLWMVRLPSIRSDVGGPWCRAGIEVELEFAFRRRLTLGYFEIGEQFGAGQADFEAEGGAHRDLIRRLQRWKALNLSWRLFGSGRTATPGHSRCLRRPCRCR